MAKRQSRRSISLNRRNYEAAKEVAEQRELSLSGLVEAALAAVGVPIVVHPQLTPDQVRAHPTRKAKAERIADRRNGTKPKPSRERQVLGDGTANALDFR